MIRTLGLSFEGGSFGREAQISRLIQGREYGYRQKRNINKFIPNLEQSYFSLQDRKIMFFSTFMKCIHCSYWTEKLLSSPLFTVNAVLSITIIFTSILASYSNFFQPTWSVISVLIVMEIGTISPMEKFAWKMLNRASGTAIGGIVGALLLFLNIQISKAVHPDLSGEQWNSYVTLFFLQSLTCCSCVCVAYYFATKKAQYKYSCIVGSFTAALVILNEQLETSLERIVSVYTGLLLSAIISLVVVGRFSVRSETIMLDLAKEVAGHIFLAFDSAIDVTLSEFKGDVLEHYSRELELIRKSLYDVPTQWNNYVYFANWFHSEGYRKRMEKVKALVIGLRPMFHRMCAIKALGSDSGAHTWEPDMRALALKLKAQCWLFKEDLLHLFSKNLTYEKKIKILKRLTVYKETPAMVQIVEELYDKLADLRHVSNPVFMAQIVFIRFFVKDVRKYLNDVILEWIKSTKTRTEADEQKDWEEMKEALEMAEEDLMQLESDVSVGGAPDSRSDFRSLKKERSISSCPVRRSYSDKTLKSSWKRSSQRICSSPRWGSPCKESSPYKLPSEGGQATPKAVRIQIPHLWYSSKVKQAEGDQALCDDKV